MSSIDVFLSDQEMAPAGSEHLFAEKVVRLSRIPVAYHPPEGMPEVAPLPAQKNGYVTFGYFVKSFVTGDEHGWPGLGYSYAGFVPVKEEITERAPRTLWLIAGAATIWLIFGVLIGVLSAVKRRTVIDRAAMGFALLGISAPVFWLGLIALWVFWRTLGWTGGTGYVPMEDGICCGQDTWLMHLILPWTVLSLLYMAIYVVMTLGAFAVILAMRRDGAAIEDISELAGLSKTNLPMAFAMAMFMFSLAGIPPLAGFFAKLYVFMAAIKAELYTLAVIGVLNSIVALYYYLVVVKVMYVDHSPEENTPIPISRAYVWVLGAASIIVILIGSFAVQPIFDWALRSAQSLIGSA